MQYRNEFCVLHAYVVVAITTSIEAALAVRRLYNDECHVIRTHDRADAWADFYEAWPASFWKASE